MFSDDEDDTIRVGGCRSSPVRVEAQEVIQTKVEAVGSDFSTVDRCPISPGTIEWMFGQEMTFRQLMPIPAPHTHTETRSDDLFNFRQDSRQQFTSRMFNSRRLVSLSAPHSRIPGLRHSRLRCPTRR